MNDSLPNPNVSVAVTSGNRFYAPVLLNLRNSFPLSGAQISIPRHISYRRERIRLPTRSARVSFSKGRSDAPDGSLIDRTADDDCASESLLKSGSRKFVVKIVTRSSL